MEGYFLYIADKLESLRLGHGSGKYDILRELRSYKFWVAVLAELIATMVFVFVGTMSAVSLQSNISVSTEGQQCKNCTEVNILVTCNDRAANIVKVRAVVAAVSFFFHSIWVKTEGPLVYKCRHLSCLISVFLLFCFLLFCFEFFCGFYGL